MTLVDFAAKVEHEGGVIDALRYADLTADDIVDEDPRAQELCDVWEALENAWAVVARLEGEADVIIDRVLEELEDGV